jgi:hypothetical protein
MRPALASLVLASSCAPLVVQDAREVGTIQGPAINGRDGGASLRIRDGDGVHDVWVFGDSFTTAEDADGISFHSSSYSITDDLDARDGLDEFVEPLDAVGSPLPFPDATDDERAYTLAHLPDDSGACDAEPCFARWATWPGTNVAVDDGFLVFYGLIHADPDGFASRGNSIATWTGDLADRPVRPVLDVDPEHPTLLFRAGEPTFGTGAIVVDDLLYAYGCDVGGFLAAPCKLGRVPVADALERDAWTFWDGGGWSADLSRAVAVVDAAPIASVAWNEHLGRYVLVYSAILSNDVVSYTRNGDRAFVSETVLVVVALD